MTKKDPLKLCPICKERQELYVNGIDSYSTLIVCSHDWVEEGEDPNWFKFSEKKPAKNQWVIVWRKELMEPFQMTWGNFKRMKEILIGDLELLTHWMPLPAPPKEQNEKESS